MICHHHDLLVDDNDLVNRLRVSIEGKAVVKYISFSAKIRNSPYLLLRLASSIMNFNDQDGREQRSRWMQRWES